MTAPIDTRHIHQHSLVAPRQRSEVMSLVVVALMASGSPVIGAAEDEVPNAFVQDVEIPQEILTYDAAFFDRYRPNSALDMVQRIPGFQIDNGDNKRGFGAASGNILINADFNQLRYRSIFAGERDLSSLDVIAVEDRTDGRRVILTLSGSF